MPLGARSQDRSLPASDGRLAATEAIEQEGQCDVLDGGQLRQQHALLEHEAEVLPPQQRPIRVAEPGHVPAGPSC